MFRPTPERFPPSTRDTRQFAILMLAMSLLSAGCGVEAEESELSEVDFSTSAITGTRADRSLAVTDPQILEKFSFIRVMSAIRSTSTRTGEKLADTESPRVLFQRWMRSFDIGTDGCSRPEIDPNGFGLKCPRLAEATLSLVDPFASSSGVRFEPVGLFNRFDLMPASGENCGEYRIVYAMRSSNILVLGRAFIIFEAALPNPTPSSGVAGCLPVARFWQSLTTDLDTTSRATKLENFYFNGTAVSGFSPVVSAAHFGLRNSNGTLATASRAGQIRTNFFIDAIAWNLREFKLETKCSTSSTCQLLFNHVTVKNNPAEELFAGNASSTAVSAFQAEFTEQVVPLSSLDASSISMSTSNTFNEFESVSQPSLLVAPRVVYKARANTAIRDRIQAKLTSLGSRLTPNNIFDRATSQTCAGCHQLSNNADLGNGVRFPPSNGFVHIDENRTLSPALTNVFLPARLRNLERFITTLEVSPTAASAMRTPPN